MRKQSQDTVSKVVLCRVEQVALEMGVSTRRVRVLLQQGRLLGEKKHGLWFANYPLRLSEGLRGPQIGFKQPRRDPCMPKRSEGIETALAPAGEIATGGSARGSAKTTQTALLQTKPAGLKPSMLRAKIDAAGKEVETVP